MRFRSTCFRVFSSGHGFKCGFHRQRLEVVLSEGYLFTCSRRTFLVHFARTWIHVTQKMLSLLQGAVRVKCFLTGVVGLQNNQKNSFATSLTLSNPNCLPPPLASRLGQPRLCIPTSVTTEQSVTLGFSTRNSGNSSASGWLVSHLCPWI